MSTRAISYLRYSTPEQSLGDSERRQVELAERYCREHDLTLAPSDVLKDLGLSAYRGTHRKEGAFASFLAAVQKGAVPRGTVLIVETWDKLSLRGAHASLAPDDRNHSRWREDRYATGWRGT